MAEGGSTIDNLYDSIELDIQCATISSPINPDKLSNILYDTLSLIQECANGGEGPVNPSPTAIYKYRTDNCSWRAILPDYSCNDVIGGMYFSVISGGEGNKTESNAFTCEGNTIYQSICHTFIGGGAQNRIAYNASCGVITGGVQNQVTCACSSVLGGGYNSVAATASTIVGGSGNIISKAGGGSSCVAGNFIGGGANNKALGAYNVIGGGNNNETSSDCYANGGYDVEYSTVLGGRWNSVRSSCSSSVGSCNIVPVNMPCTHIVGNGILADRCNTTFVNNLSIKDIPQSGDGLPVGSLYRDCSGYVLIKY